MGEWERLGACVVIFVFSSKTNIFLRVFVQVMRGVGQRGREPGNRVIKKISFIGLLDSLAPPGTDPQCRNQVVSVPFGSDWVGEGGCGCVPV